MNWNYAPYNSKVHFFSLLWKKDSESIYLHNMLACDLKFLFLVLFKVDLVNLQASGFSSFWHLTQRIIVLVAPQIATNNIYRSCCYLLLNLSLLTVRMFFQLLVQMGLSYTTNQKQKVVLLWMQRNSSYWIVELNMLMVLLT